MTDTLTPPDVDDDEEPTPKRSFSGLFDAFEDLFDWAWKGIRGGIREGWAWVLAHGEIAVKWVTVLVLAVVAIVPVVGNEGSVQDVDPMFMRTIIERTDVYGGTFYENGIYNKGPLEAIFYNLANHITSYNGFWFAISLFVALVAAVIAYAGARTAIYAGANRLVALAVGAVLYVHFALADSDYVRVLFSRNLTVTLLAGVWILALSTRAWFNPRRSLASAIAVGALLGFAAQALTTTVFAGAAVGLTAAALLFERQGRDETRRLGRWAVGAAVLSFLSAPVWYLARGSFSEYWASWWTHAKFMSVGTNRPLASQFALGWDKFYEYYTERPGLFVLVAVFAGVTWVMWDDLRRQSRIVHVGLLGWFSGAWIELILSQRYSSHYFSVLAVPTALMGAALVGHATRVAIAHRPSTKVWIAVPLVATVLAVYLTGPSVFMESVKRTSRFTSVQQWAGEDTKGEGGGDRSVRAVLDLVSGHNDPLLAWTTDPTVYLKYQRVPATRFSWKSFLLGEIYLGDTDEKYVLSHSWQWFADDIGESNPAAFVETEPFDATYTCPDNETQQCPTPFQTLVRDGFREVYPGEAAKVWLRDDVADSLFESNRDRDWSDPGGRVDGTGWGVESTGAVFDEGGIGRADDTLLLANGPCYRLEGRLDVIPPGDKTNVAFRFDDPDDPEAERMFLALEGDRAGSGSAGLGATGFETVESGIDDDGPVNFALVVGARSAALIVNDRIVGAVRLPEGYTKVSLESRTETLDIRDLSLGLPPAGSGCN